MSRLPGPNMFSSSSTGYKAMARSDSGRLQREEQVQEIIELKKALAKTRQDLQKTRSRRESQDNRSSSDEDTHHGYKRDEMVASMSGSMNAVSNKPCLNRELLAKLRSMTETIKMLSTENVALREENDQLMTVRDDGMTEDANDNDEVVKLKSLVQNYEKQVNDLSVKVRGLEEAVECKEKQPPVQQQEKDKYKSLARRLKDERNQYKELVEEKKREQDELKVEIEKMTDIIGELRDNCGKLQEELLQVRNDEPRRVREKGSQTSGPVRRSSVSEVSPRVKITPKRTRSTVTTPTSYSGPTSPRQSQISKSIELSKPKIRNTASVSASVPNSPAKGARIVKPVQRSPSSSSIPPKSSASPRPSPAPVRKSAGKMSRIPTPSKSRIPVKPQPRPSVPEYQDSDEILFINEENLTGSDDNMDVVTDMSRKMTTSRDSSHKMEVETTPPPAVEEVSPQVFPPPHIPEETMNSDPEFPAPPRPEDLEALEAEMTAPPPPPPVEEEPPITTPRTLRRADSMRQRMAAKRIQRTWKHFYQELEEKKTDGGEGQEGREEESLAGVQAAIISHGARVASLAAARARGGIYTARPWQGRDSETESENEDIIESLQGIIRSHSFRLKNLQQRGDEGLFQAGKVSSIRQKFVRKSPEGASDDSMADTDTIA